MKILFQIVRITVGFTFLSFGIALTKIAGLGMDPWGLLHEGMDNLIPFLDFGEIIVYSGIFIMIISVILFKSKIGIGTILNAVLVGFMINFFLVILPSEVTETTAYGFFAIGLITLNFGRALYISSDLGPGPRDGLYVGLTRVTQIDIKYGKPFIEFLVLGTGYLLGGTFGVGTIILIVVSGYMVEFFFKIFKFDPKKKTQNDIIADIKRLVTN